MFKIIILLCLSSIANCAKNWGEPNCVGDEFNGTCVEPHRCLSTNPYIMGLVYPKACTTANGDPGVCCTDCTLVHNASNAVLDKSSEVGLLWKTGEKAWDKCLEYIQKYEYDTCKQDSYMIRDAAEEQCHNYIHALYINYFFEQMKTARGEFPHMALLGYNKTQKPEEWGCSGSLISERHILTAGHCIYSEDLGPVTEVALGMLRRSDPADLWHRYKIKRVIPHPEYDPPSEYYDIAILETEIPVEFINETVLPACLPAHDQFIPYDNPEFSITAAGWGTVGYLKNVSDSLQRVYLTKFSEEECEIQYPRNGRSLRNGLDHTTQMCYGDKTAIKDTCMGDSGGPLQTDTYHPSCISTVFGVTSYGSACGFLGQAGIYTKVATFLPWIESIVWP